MKTTIVAAASVALTSLMTASLAATQSPPSLDYVQGVPQKIACVTSKESNTWTQAEITNNILSSPEVRETGGPGPQYHVLGSHGGSSIGPNPSFTIVYPDKCTLDQTPEGLFFNNLTHSDPGSAQTSDVVLYTLYYGSIIYCGVLTNSDNSTANGYHQCNEVA